MKTENMGWQCPNCLVVYAPSILECWCGSITKESNISLGGFGTASVSGYSCDGYISTSPNGICSKCALPEWKHYNLNNI